jgi:type I restriction enzyme, S subunit
MDFDWPSEQLGGLCLKIGSGATPRGGSNVYVDDGTRFIRSQNVHDLRFEFAGLAHIDDNAAEQLRGVAIESHDVLVNITGDSVARVCLAPEDGREARVSQHVAIVRPDPRRLLRRFLAYWLVSPRVKGHLLTLASAGATRKALTKRMLETLELRLPGVDEQQRIVSVLGVLDDKIDSNRRLASLLEEIAAALFRARFVDFAGVEHYEESEIGPIPLGWRDGLVRDLVRLKYGKALKAADRVPGAVAVVGSSGILGTHNIPLVVGPAIIVGRKGTVGSIIWVPRDAWPIDTTFIAEPVDGVDPVFAYFALLQANLPNLVSDSGVPGLNRGAAEESPILVPPQLAIDEFASLAQPLIQQKDRFVDEAETLASVRDLLLPKLISGEIRVPYALDPEEVIGPAAERVTGATE